MHARARLRPEPLEGRFTPAAGDLDPTFGAGGVAPAGLPDAPARVAVLPDGRFYAVGGAAPGAAAVARYLADGSPDPSFGAGGVVRLPAVARLTAVATLPDGGVAVGTVAGNSDPPAQQFVVTRLTPAGSVDPTFGTGGAATFGEPGAWYELNALVAQADGRVLVVGGRTSGTFVDDRFVWTREMEVARLTADGRPDPGFGRGGVATVAHPAGVGSDAAALAAAVLPDGRVVVAGRAANSPAAARLTADGRPDPAFGAGGLAVVAAVRSGLDRFSAVTPLADGRVVFAGQLFRGDALTGLAARLTADGRLDPTYGAGGLATAAPLRVVPSVTAFEMAAAADAAGRAVFAATEFTPRGGGAARGTAALRLAADGAADAGFGAGGWVDVAALPGAPRGAYLDRGLAALPNGDVLLGGGGALVRLIGSGPPAGFTPAAAGTLVVGGAAAGVVAVATPTGGGYAAAGSMAATPGDPGTARGTTADVNGDGTPDYVVGGGPGGPPRVTVLDGASGRVLADFPAFEAGFTGGVFVAAADLDRDGRAEVVVTPDRGGGPRVVVFSVAPGGGVSQRASFLGIDDAAFRGGARAAVGDVDGDGTPDVVVTAGFGGGPRTAIFTGRSVLAGSPERLVADFFAFPGADAQTLRAGAFAAAGDVDGDGFADLVFGGGPGGAPRVLVLSGALVSAGRVDAAQANPVANFFAAGDPADREGARVAVTDGDGDGRADVAVGSGAGRPAKVRVYLGKDLAGGGEPPATELDPFGGAVLADGVYVG